MSNTQNNKAHNKTLDIVKQLIKQDPSLEEWAIAKFPELQDSDERIKSQLINFLDELFSLGKNTNFDKYDKVDLTKWINWINKHSLHEWTEDDEVKLKSTKALLKHPEIHTMKNEGIINKSIEWIDELKYRIQPYNKLSEKEKEIINTIISDVRRSLRGCGLGTYESNIRYDAIEFLESLLSKDDTPLLSLNTSDRIMSCNNPDVIKGTLVCHDDCTNCGYRSMKVLSQKE